MDLQPVIAAFQAHQWVLFGALIVGGLIAFAKQGWFSTWIQSKLPASDIPYYAVVIGVLTMMVTDIETGKTWQQAILDGFFAATTAVFGHQLLIEGVRGGKEVVPVAKWAKPSPPAV
jgi:hypothetical protein